MEGAEEALSSVTGTKPRALETRWPLHAALGTERLPTNQIDLSDPVSPGDQQVFTSLRKIKEGCLS